MIAAGAIDLEASFRRAATGHELPFVGCKLTHSCRVNLLLRGAYETKAIQS